MSLWAQLEKELAKRGVSGLRLRQAQSAMKALKGVLGSGFVLPDYEADLAERVNVPGEKHTFIVFGTWEDGTVDICLLYTSPSPRDQRGSRMPSSA